ncbi:MAG: SWIM zinc finger family protein [Pseudomonadota bacterium]
MSELARLVTEKSLRRYAGATIFDRGVGYFRTGAVADLADTGAAVKARVMGSEEYRVTLRAERGTLGYSCTCPMGGDGDFCKHVVATGLAWLAQRRNGKNAPRPPPLRATSTAWAATWHGPLRCPS